MVSEDAGPVSAIPSHKVQIIHAPKIAINRVVVRYIQSASCVVKSSTTHAQGIPKAVTPPLADRRV
jgi:hypothetical protein